MDTFERLLGQNDFVLRQRALGESSGFAKGESSGFAKGESSGFAKEARQSLLLIIDTRFPALAGLARIVIKDVTQLDRLHVVMQQIVLAADEESARKVLTSFSATLS